MLWMKQKQSMVHPVPSQLCREEAIGCEEMLHFLMFSLLSSDVGTVGTESTCPPGLLINRGGRKHHLK